MPADPERRDASAASDSAPGAFGSTQWSLVARAAADGGSESQAALERLCRVYWIPLYAFARRAGLSPADAEDGTQGFFEHLLSAGGLARADPERGRFRTFLLSSFRNYLGQQHARARAQKRGGGAVVFSLDQAEIVEGILAESLATPESPEAVFDRHWAQRVVQEALRAVRLEYSRLGKEALFSEVKSSLWGGRGEVPFRDIALRLGMTEAAVKMAAVRLRRRMLEALRAEVAETVAAPSDVEGELKYLLVALQA